MAKKQINPLTNHKTLLQLKQDLIHTAILAINAQVEREIELFQAGATMLDTLGIKLAEPDKVDALMSIFANRDRILLAKRELVEELQTLRTELERE